MNSDPQAVGGRRAALIFIFVTVLIDILSFGVIIPVLPGLVRQFTDGDFAQAAWWVGTFGMLFAGIQFVCTPIQGALSDRFGRRPVILFSCLGLGIDFIVMAMAQTLPWLLVVSYAAYTAQYLGDLVLGSYASGFCGGLVLTLSALSLSRRRAAPPAITMILPGFWLLVPGSMGLIGIAELFGADGDSALGVTFISMFSVAIGLQTGFVLWRLIRRRHF